MTRRRLHVLLAWSVLSVVFLVGGAQRYEASAAGQAQKPSLPEPPRSLPVARTWTPPDPKAIPGGSAGESILLGMRIFTETPKYAAAYVGNQLSCSNCHLQGGTMSYGISVVGAPGWFPMFSERAKRDISLEDRIQECVTRSENGTPLPHGGPELTALLSYFDWVSRAPRNDSPARGLASVPALQGDPARGGKIYQDKCSTCHGEDGAGVAGILPALWGPNAYNDGAGMNQVKKMAAFVLRNMPQNNPGTLTAQQAFDVSAYVASKPHSRYNPAYDIY